MVQKQHPSPLKPPNLPSSSSEEEKEGEGEEEINNKSTSHANHAHNAHSSEDEGDKNQDEEEEEEDSENEKAKYIAARMKTPQPTKQKGQKDESDYEADSGSASDSESPATKSNSTKPMDGHPRPKKPSTEAASATASKKQGESNENGSKKRQRNKQPVLRVWGPDDVIALLKGMIEYSEMGPADAFSDLTAFHKFINKSLKVKVIRSQLQKKIQRLKQKYKSQSERAREGKEVVFSKPHDKLAYKLSKKVFGGYDPAVEDEDEMDMENDVTTNSVNKESPGGGNAKRRRKNVEERVEQQSLNPSHMAQGSLGTEDYVQNQTITNGGVPRDAVLYPHLNELFHSSEIVSALRFRENEVKRAFELMRPSKLEEWDQSSMKIRLKERDICMEKITLKYELTKECYDLLKSSSV